jgi:hypothetical protein
MDARAVQEKQWEDRLREREITVPGPYMVWPKNWPGSAREFMEAFQGARHASTKDALAEALASEHPVEIRAGDRRFLLGVHPDEPLGVSTKFNVGLEITGSKGVYKIGGAKREWDRAVSFSLRRWRKDWDKDVLIGTPEGLPGDILSIVGEGEVRVRGFRD